MAYQRTTIAMVILSTLVVGCGGESGGPTDVAATKIQSGKIIDGYIQGAVVFADINANGELDQDLEPWTTSGESGIYQLDYGVQDKCAGLVPIIVDVPETAVDEVRGNVDGSFRLYRPPSYRTDEDTNLHVTPFTALTQDMDYLSCEEILALPVYERKFKELTQIRVNSDMASLYGIEPSELYSDFLSGNDKGNSEVDLVEIAETLADMKKVEASKIALAKVELENELRDTGELKGVWSIDVNFDTQNPRYRFVDIKFTDGGHDRLVEVTKKDGTYEVENFYGVREVQIGIGGIELELASDLFHSAEVGTAKYNCDFGETIFDGMGSFVSRYRGYGVDKLQSCQPITDDTTAYYDEYVVAKTQYVDIDGAIHKLRGKRYYDSYDGFKHTGLPAIFDNLVSHRNRIDPGAVTQITNSFDVEKPSWVDAPINNATALEYYDEYINSELGVVIRERLKRSAGIGKHFLEVYAIGSEKYFSKTYCVRNGAWSEIKDGDREFCEYDGSNLGLDFTEQVQLYKPLEVCLMGDIDIPSPAALHKEFTDAIIACGGSTTSIQPEDVIGKTMTVQIYDEVQKLTFDGEGGVEFKWTETASADVAPLQQEIFGTTWDIIEGNLVVENEANGYQQIWALLKAQDSQWSIKLHETYRDGSDIDNPQQSEIMGLIISLND